MNEYPRLFVTTGLHAGASVALSEGHDLRIGSASGADLILADAGIASHHATVRLRAGRLALIAASEGVCVFGRPLRIDVPALLRHGATFSLSETLLQFSNGEPLTEQVAQQAERAWLFTHAPLAWLRKRCATLPRRTWIALAGALLVPALLSCLNLFAPQPPASQTALLEQPAFRHVHLRVDKETGRRFYAGYVQTAGELGALSLAVRAQGQVDIMRVAVIDAMQEQLSDFLDKYYRGARIEAAEPGAFVATPPAADAYLLPESWDYGRLGRLAREQIDGLQSLRFAGHENNSGPVQIPLEALGLNIISTPHAAWLADLQGTRYFVGARIPIGKITRIAPCGATVVRDDGSVYSLSASRTDPAGPC